MSDRAPGQGRYAHVEREQRWLLDERPLASAGPVTITDRYVIGTTLRLRRVEGAAGDVVYKLGQKVRPHVDSPEVVRLTSLYLRPDEYELLTALPAQEVSKSRWHLEDGRIYVIDVFTGVLAGLVLAEVELLPGESPAALPTWARAEVTNDDRYSGGRLAELTSGQVQRLAWPPSG